MKHLCCLLGVVGLLLCQPARAQLLAFNHAKSQNQNQGNRPDMRTVSLQTALNELENRYRVSFIYPTNVVNVQVPAGARARNVEEELTNLLAGQNLSYRKVQERFYAIVPEKGRNARLFRQIEQIEKKAGPVASTTPTNLPGTTLTKLAQIGWSLSTSVRPLEDVRGRVTDPTGNGIPGVSVVVKGTTRGTTTNANGDFSLNVPGNATLVFSFVGYVTQEVSVAGRTQINLTMTEDVRSLSEVVAVGYGTQKRASVTGAISSVSSQEVIQLPVPSVQQAIQGRVPGVSVVANGAPGEEPIVRIRGIGSINYASNPLYVIDGFPTGDLNSFDTRDIESVDVLRDASSAAIFGSRAANGVILITTKRGNKDGKLHVNYDGYVGTQSAWRTLDLLNRDEYIQYGTALRTNAGQPVPSRFANLNQPIYAGATQTYAQTDTDWQAEMFRAAPITQHSISLSAGSEKSRVYASTGYFNQQGIMLGTGYRRGNFRINSDHTVSKRITFGQTLALAYDDRLLEANAGGRTQIQNMIRMTPYMPVRDPFLVGGFRGPDGADASDPQNPVRAALQDRGNAQRFKLLGMAYVDVAITPWLKYRAAGGIDYVMGRDFTFQPIYNESFNARALANINESRYTFVSPYITNQLTFDKTFGQHTLNAVVVAERQAGLFTSLGVAGNATSNDIREVTAITPTSVGASGGRSRNVLLSYLGRVNYEYAGKYLLSASFRRDGSSRFAPGRRWGNFPSASVGWRISEEAFLKGVPQISELKLRASYGTMGFNGIGEYAWQVAVAQNTNAILGGVRTQGTFFDRLGNTELSWETTRMANIGLDLGLFNNALTFSAEYYDRRTNGLILNQPVAPSIGFSQSPIVNIGDMRNRGFELQVGYNKSRGDFTFGANANLGIVRNRVLSLGPTVSPLFAGNNADFGGFDITRTAPGEPIQYFYGWRVQGIFQNQAEIDAAPRQPNAKPGDIRFADVNGDGVINADDRTNLGNFLPDFTYGATFDARYKNFDLSLFIQGVQGNEVYNGVKVLRQGMLRLFNAGTEVLNAWTPQNTNTDVPRAIDGDPNQNSRTSDRFIEDGSYLRVKNLSIGYTLPTAALGWTRGTLTRARLYVAGTNLLTFTRYTGYDPEIGSRFNQTLANGIDYGQFPAARTLMVGVQLGF